MSDYSSSNSRRSRHQDKWRLRKETGRPAQFDSTEQPRAAVFKIREGRFLFPGQVHEEPTFRRDHSRGSFMGDRYAPHVSHQARWPVRRCRPNKYPCHCRSRSGSIADVRAGHRRSGDRRPCHRSRTIDLWRRAVFKANIGGDPPRAAAGELAAKSSTEVRNCAALISQSSEALTATKTPSGAGSAAALYSGNVGPGTGRKMTGTTRIIRLSKNSPTMEAREDNSCI